MCVSVSVSQTKSVNGRLIFWVMYSRAWITCLRFHGGTFSPISSSLFSFVPDFLSLGIERRVRLPFHLRTDAQQVVEIWARLDTSPGHLKISHVSLWKMTSNKSDPQDGVAGN